MLQSAEKQNKIAMINWLPIFEDYWFSYIAIGPLIRLKIYAKL